MKETEKEREREGETNKIILPSNWVKLQEHFHVEQKQHQIIKDVKLARFNSA